MTSRRFRLATLLLTGFAFAATVTAEDRERLRIPRVTVIPSLEAIAGGARPPGAEVTGFKQREPGDGVPVSQPTSAYLSYDDQNLYVVFVCKDGTGKVRANLTKREAIIGDDVVGVLLDTYHDGRRAYMFIANPLGIQLDGVVAEGQGDDYSYDTLWRSEGRVTADGYVVLFAIPFKSLRFSNDDLQTWGLALARIIPRANETSFWPYVTRRVANLIKQLATAEGIEQVSPGRNLQAIPYGSFASARLLEDTGDRVTDRTGRAGLDAKAVIKDAVTLDLTVNPDFSQVESDEPQVTINQRFEVFFPEKRPFFIENAGYFETPQNLFFSRRVADPRVGARVTGRGAGWAFGGLVTNDEQPGQDVDPDDPRYGRVAGVVALRAQRELARQSNVGLIFTDRELGPTANRVFGIDGRWTIDQNWTATGQWVGSTTDGEDGTGRRGSSTYAELSRNSRKFRYSGEFLSRSPDFEAQLGFIPRVDLIETEHDAGYNWFPKSSRVLRVGADVEARALWDYGGRRQEWVIEPGFEIELPGQTEIGVRHWSRAELYEGVEFRPTTSGAYVSSEWLRWLSAQVFYEWGAGVNYYPAEGVRPFLASRQDVEAGLTLRPTSRLRLDQSYLYARLGTRDDSVPTLAPGGTDVFNNHILRTRATYQFTRELSLRAIVDYEAVLPNESLVSLEREKRFGLDVLATYMVNPWTAVYVGYTDVYENWLLAPLTDRPVSRGGAPTTPVGRQVFVKVSYLLKY